MRGLIGKKLGMTQIFDSASGAVIPVTVVEAGPCVVTQVKTRERDGYQAVQAGYGERKRKHTPKPEQGHLDKHKIPPQRILAEFEALPGVSYRPGQKFTVDLFQVGDRVSVAGRSKGKGFTGVMKRHGFRGGPATHGQREHPRSPGSIGQASFPSRVFKGLKMAGQQGNRVTTARNLEVVEVNKEQNRLFLKGSLPGPQNGIVLINKLA